MRDNGSTIKLTGTVHTSMQTVQSMWASGMKISSMEEELKNGLMALNMTADIKMAKNMETVS